jgi:MEMO1 family protein
MERGMNSPKAKKGVRWVRVSLLIFLILMLGFPSSAFFADIREPAVAGMFYPKDKKELISRIDNYLDNVKYQRVKGKLVAMIVPHAGYDYSGQVAAYGYKELEGKTYNRVILIGASHYQRFDGISVAEYDYYQTPLGKVKVDRDFAKKLIESSSKFTFLPEAHNREHSLEVQLPFLQRVMNKDLKIVPIIFGNASIANSQILAMSLASLVDDKTLIICSTDWSHYHDYKRAIKLDKEGISAVLKGDLSSYVALLSKGSSEACAAPAVITTMLLTPSLGANKTELLNYANSGDVTGDKSRVVGYASIAYSSQSSPLLKAEMRQLLGLARRSIRGHLLGKEPEKIDVEKGVLGEKRGVFVTLKKQGKLRGCIGYILPHIPLAEAVQAMAVSAAVSDARFPKVTIDELPKIDIEISVLSRLEKVKNIDEIKIGRDGLYIVEGRKSGLLLPQVAVEQNWNRNQLLENVCYKARLSKDAWKNSDAALYRFSADIFHEKN